MSTSTQPGGASTVSGVIYQMLWCLLRFMRLRLHTQNGRGESADAIVLLEPTGGGGDLQVVGADGTTVEQLKAKSDGGKWSLRTIIADVLPDLFLATTDGDGSRRFRFITEGSMGNWEDVYHFFGRLKAVEPPADIRQGLDDTRPLKFQTRRPKSNEGESHPPFFPDDHYTEWSLFLFIADHLRTRPAIAELRLTDDQLYRRLWTLLGSFEFVGNQVASIVQDEIDRLLLAVVDQREDIPTVRDNLAQSLLRKMGAGDVELSAEVLLKEHCLNAVPLLEWSRLRARSQEELHNQVVKSCGYAPEFDVRADVMKLRAQAWRGAPRPVVIAGDSGQGKTWSLAALALEAATDDAPVLWIEATGDPDRDSQRAANQFWLDIRGGESPIPLRQIAARLREVVPSPQPIRLRLCIDNVAKYDEAHTFLREDWPSHGVAIALSCSGGIAASLREEFRDRIDVVSCDDFSWEELHELLERRLATAWAGIPEDVREVLRRPLLASIYCEEIFDASWTPINEYQLFKQVWQRLSTGPQTGTPMDVAPMVSLAEAVLRGDPYPWTFQQLQEHRIDNAALARLERCGWLARTEDGARISHDRLLNWAVAEALCSSMRTGKRTHDAVADQITQISSGDGRIGNVFLGYVPMDALWLLTESAELPVATGARLLEELEMNCGHQPELLYEHQVRTLGSQMAPILFQRYRDLDGAPSLLKSIGRALIASAGDRLAEYARLLLTDPAPTRQRAGLKLLRDTACPELLDRLWELHCQGLSNPRPFLQPHEEDWLFRNDSWPALRSTAIRDPDWIAQRIESADPVREPIYELAWLVANLPDGKDVWRKSKNVLFQKVSAEKTHLLARCAGIFRDHDCVPWLHEQVANRLHVCCSVALEALARIEPAEAVSALKNANLRDLQTTVSWAFREVWHRLPAETDAEVLRLARQADDPWQWGLLYQDRPQDAPTELVALLLTRLEQRLEQLLRDGPVSGSTLFRDLTFVAQATTTEHLDLLESKQGSSFENCLTEYVRRQGPQRGQLYPGHERTAALTLLHRINGIGFTSVINEFLECDDRYGRHEALEWAIRHPNAATFSSARRIIASDELWDGSPGSPPVEQNAAMRLLAAHGQWEGVVEGLLRWEFQTNVDLTKERLAPRDYSGPSLDTLRHAIAGAPTPSRIIALGFLGGPPDTSAVQDLLHAADPTGKQAHACVIALRLLGDISARGVELVARQLDIAAHRHSVVQMLTRVGTAEAWAALMRDLRKNFDHITALNLINSSQYADEAADLALNRIPTERGLGDWGLLHLFVLHLRPDFRKRIVANRWLREKFHREAVASEGNFWLVGSKAAAIECLGEFDSAAAFDAAAHALATPDAHDRERYPYVLNKIDSERSLTVLLDQLRCEQDFRVRYAIGRVLSDRDMTAILQSRWQCRDPKTLAACCFAAGWAKHDPDLLDELRRCLANDDQDVVRSAMDAIDRIRDSEIGSELVLRAARANDVARTMAYLDAAVDVLDPGDDFATRPAAVREVCKSMSPMLGKAISERVKKRREKLTADLKIRSRKQ